MYFLYSILLSIGFVLMLPFFLIRREKYASGFRQRLGNYPEFKHDNRDVIWLHCVSVGETNAARPLVDRLIESFPDHRLVISTTTKTGQELARKIFGDRADAIFYFPFDFKSTVRRALYNYEPSLVLLMETEIWPRFIHEAKSSGAKVAIVNGRLSQRSFDRYSRLRSIVRRVLADVDLVLMQGDADAHRIKQLGIDAAKVSVTGNLKFERTGNDGDLTEEFRSRFGVFADKPLIMAASTHEPEERFVLEALNGEIGHSCRLMVAPRHPERFDAVATLFRHSPYSFVRRSAQPAEGDRDADVILLDSIGELRSAYPLAEIVFVGGSLIPHGGQSVLEPAAEGKAVVTGPYTANFDAIVNEFAANQALIQLRTPDVKHLREALVELLSTPSKREQLGSRAINVMKSSPKAASAITEKLKALLLN
jgi:3-deoxy-D-manno-octulosonic-acid transferase